MGEGPGCKSLGKVEQHILSWWYALVLCSASKAMDNIQPASAGNRTINSIMDHKEDEAEVANDILTYEVRYCPSNTTSMRLIHIWQVESDMGDTYDRLPVTYMIVTLEALNAHFFPSSSLHNIPLLLIFYFILIIVPH